MRRFTTMFILFVLSAALLSACGGTAATSTTEAPAPNQLLSGAQAGQGQAERESVAGQSTGADTASDAANPQSPNPAPLQDVAFQNDPNRKIIKNGDVTLEIEDALAIGINRITGIAAESGGYVLQVQSNSQAGSSSTATVGIAVPVDKFEAAMERIRTSGKRVLSEQASGQDVSQEFVDLQNQIANLEATQGRVRQFLERATTVEEALSVNRQLTELDGQISQSKGRLQFLSQRAAFSTITVQLQQVPGPTATPTPMPTAVPWQASTTVNAATATLRGIVQSLMSAVIWLGIVGVPLLLPLLIIGLIVRAYSRSRQNVRPNSPTGGDEGGTRTTA